MGFESLGEMGGRLLSWGVALPDILVATPSVACARVFLPARFLEEDLLRQREARLEMWVGPAKLHSTKASPFSPLQTAARIY